MKLYNTDLFRWTPNQRNPPPQTRQEQLEAERQFLLRLWHGILLPDERERLQKAQSMRELKDAGPFIHGRSVRLRVTESFLGLTGEEVTVFTGYRSGDCGYPFEVGKAYFVDAYRQGERWWTGRCSRTSERWKALEDIRAMRAWADRTPLSLRVFGYTRVPGQGAIADVSVRIRNGEREWLLQSDKRGYLAPVEDLPPGEYELAGVEHPDWQLGELDNGPILFTLDLTKQRCVELPIWLDPR